MSRPSPLLNPASVAGWSRNAVQRWGAEPVRPSPWLRDVARGWDHTLLGVVLHVRLPCLHGGDASDAAYRRPTNCSARASGLTQPLSGGVSLKSSLASLTGQPSLAHVIASRRRARGDGIRGTRQRSGSRRCGFTVLRGAGPSAGTMLAPFLDPRSSYFDVVKHLARAQPTRKVVWFVFWCSAWFGRNRATHAQGQSRNRSFDSGACCRCAPRPRRFTENVCCAR